jgi:hypothetical protein
MTAALTEITYGETAGVEAEFYTPDEWEGIKMTASRQEDTPQVQAAKELVEKSLVLGGQLKSLLGTRKTASFDDLLDFVGADGKYVSITKAAKIMYPLDMLQGVQVVDTPGFNDPVVSREQRSVEFLAKCDVVIMLPYSGHAFDSTDREIIFEKVRNVGVGKIIIAVNKYDVDITKGEREEDIQNYVKDQIRKTVREKQDPALEKLLGDPKPILFSAYMALLARKPLAEINGSETDKFHYSRLCHDVFEIETPAQMYEKSRLEILKQEIDNLLKKEKIEILINKSLNEIRAKIDSLRTEIGKTINRLNEEVKTLSLNPEELAEKLHDSERQKKKIDRMITGMGNDLRDFVDDKMRTAARNLENKRNMSITSLKQSVNSAKSLEEARPRVEFIFRDTVQKFKEEYEDLIRIVRTELKSKSEETISDMEEIIEKYSDGDDEKSKDYIQSCQAELRKFNDLSLDDLFAADDTNSGQNDTGGILYIIADGINSFSNVVTFGLWDKLCDKLSWNQYKKDILDKIDGILPPIETFKDALSPIGGQVEHFVDFFRQCFEADLVDVIVKQIKEARADFANREKNKKAAEEKLAKAEIDKKKFEKQAEEADRIIKTLPL